MPTQSEDRSPDAMLVLEILLSVAAIPALVWSVYLLAVALGSPRYWENRLIDAMLRRNAA